ncbi:CRISPR-associated CARF protein Csa3 [Pyrobaculum sp. 3827-6]|uniref:CRISPR-associated CARF protein Csa3 n=1 Tax=Pyrobaculum sp. 3827-6 TaxID=2983604 RepID=UPI0021D7E1D8|nr:CRISPR-associated CARF protein Csa3 [Pyrobaculum sp. 3827-6]MCU7786883.1 CRISPR-associated CARF protein Csa3 [Pyrobaculum sp. 3827-6]
MHLAVTVGFDEALVVRAIANIKANEIYLLRGFTSSEGDAKSQEAVRRIIRALQRGSERVVDLRDPARGLREIAEIEFDVVALAGGPRLLVLLTFAVAALKGAKIYVVPEYASDALDVTGLGSIVVLKNLSEAKLRLLSKLTEWKHAEVVAKEVGLDTSTVYRHLNSLDEVGLVRGEGKRRKKYVADRLVTELASITLKYIQ